MRIALFGGTFDPIHSGHVRLAKEFASRLGFDRVLLMPTFVPPHKLKDGMAPAEDRLARGAAVWRRRENRCWRCPIWRFVGAGASFTADTLEALAAEYPEAQWALITGADMFLTLGTWNRFPAIARRGCAVRRTPAPCHDGAAADLRRGAGAAGGSLRPCGALEPVDLSSTAVRERVRRGEALAGMVPPAVERYIKERGMYTREEERQSMNRDEQFIEIIRGRLAPSRLPPFPGGGRSGQKLAALYGGDPKKGPHRRNSP